MSMRQYVSKYIAQYPELLDLVAADDMSMQVPTSPHTFNYCSTSIDRVCRCCS